MSIPPNNAANALNLFSVRRFEALLGLPIDQIEIIASKAGSYYSPFIPLPPRRWFPKKEVPIKKRNIDNPITPLKELQATILNRLLQTIGLPGYMNGGVKGRTVIDNIELHRNSSVLVTVDIKSFPFNF